jgi:plastocyanin
LAENNNHGGEAGAYPDVTGLPPGQNVTGSTVGINNFVTQFGDMTNTGSALTPPTVSQGQSFTFQNNDSTGVANTDFLFHTITACANPCNKATGIAYPRADGPIEFDSGELGFGPRGSTATENRKTWTIPNDLPNGTYSYFCRVHPYMRGAFRVVAG